MIFPNFAALGKREEKERKEEREKKREEGFAKIISKSLFLFEITLQIFPILFWGLIEIRKGESNGFIKP